MAIAKNTDVVADHIKRVNKAIQYIDEHLDSELSIDLIAGIANFSPYHFHRVFKSVVNEPLNSYIIRKRIEKAAAVLMRQKQVSITELYTKYGFSSNSSFTRAFKKFYRISPTLFRVTCPGRFSKISQANSKNGQSPGLFEPYICSVDEQKLQTMNANIEVKEMPELKLAYISHIGHDNLDITYKKLFAWAAEKGLLRDGNIQPLTIYHDSFKITAPEKIRMSACLILKDPITVDGAVGLITINKGKYVVGHYEIKPEDFGPVWGELFVWLSKNGYKKSDKDVFEIYHNDFTQHPENLSRVDFYIPIT
ncbi:AraC family transcriptional regulator [Mucilaginibacter boryungensis]|uniref:AraC family transcriptional regulator n=1 Tax=Mucilaginibacter boryungensis TaxID=768480 RepID=A0ABR9XMY0_9SPHI|nr:GyrI-like domain-containing protein [Mucilaginibacter boryungensis]MBE9668738.1 AraC family transcriptional regulator [Mucilaginibacter boryungensis]